MSRISKKIYIAFWFMAVAEIVMLLTPLGHFVRTRFGEEWYNTVVISAFCIVTGTALHIVYIHSRNWWLRRMSHRKAAQPHYRLARSPE